MYYIIHLGGVVQKAFHSRTEAELERTRLALSKLPFHNMKVVKK